MKKILLIILLGLIAVSVHAQSLAQRLDSLLFNDSMLKTSEVGIAVFDLTAGKSLFNYQDEKLYRPASTEKVVTSVSALAILGMDYTLNAAPCRREGQLRTEPASCPGPSRSDCPQWQAPAYSGETAYPARGRRCRHPDPLR